MLKIEAPAKKDFVGFGKITRAHKALGCTITEKLDGTNAQIVINGGRIVGVGSRTRWITPGKDTDNFGFAGWVEENYDELLGLGEGQHFGEWYGSGIQRGYGLSEKRFALFNVGRWVGQELPTCCEVVPTLHNGEFSKDLVSNAMDELKATGSVAVPGYENPEGIIVFLHGPRTYLKATFDHSEGKWQEAA